MGIEHRSGVPHEDLYDLAIKQLKSEDSIRKKVHPVLGAFDSVEKYFSAGNRLVVLQDSLGCSKIVHLADPSEVKLIKWFPLTGLPIVTLAKE